MDYKVRFKEILKGYGITGKEFCDLMGYDYSYYRKCTQNKGDDVVSWIKSFVLCYEMSVAFGKNTNEPQAVIK